MTPAQLRDHCDAMNNETGTGGQTALAKRLGWSPRTMRRKLAGESPVDLDEELAITHLMGCGMKAGNRSRGDSVRPSPISHR